MKKVLNTLIIAVLTLYVFLSACGGASETEQEALPTPTIVQPTAAPTALPEATAEEQAVGSTEEEQSEDTSSEIVVTRTPAPTATPGRITQEVEQLAESLGLDQTNILGLQPGDWINLGISALIVVLGYLVSTLLIHRLFDEIERRAGDDVYVRVLTAIDHDIRRFVVLLALNYAIQRLNFVSAALKVLASDIIYVAGIIIVVRAVLITVAVAEKYYKQSAAEEDRENELSPLIVLLSRGARILAVYIAVAVGLSRFGVDALALSAALGLSGLALSLAAQDTIADAIAGFIILVDRPFRIGDRIEIEGENTWGDVMDIGLRTTKIRTRDNRMVIMPNSTISENLIINYSYPDPQYRIQTHVEIAYGTDIEMARALIVETVRSVDGVLKIRPVDALYHEMGDWAMIFRVRWWVETYADTRRIVDRVHTALQNAFDAAGFVSPNPTQTTNLKIDDDTSERLSRAFRNGKRIPEQER